MTQLFLSSRLPMARSLRGLTAAALAKSANVTPEWLSKVERNRTTPSDELVGRLARALDFPVEFFYRDPIKLPSTEAFHFRASSKLAQKDETAARSFASLAAELSEWMDRAYKLPIPGIPEIQELAGAEVDAGPEIAAEALRSYWGLGTAPISNMMTLLESKGARIFSVSGTYQAIDAFSFRYNGSAIIFLNPSKSAERLRFDLAHELGHLLMHGGSLYESESKLRERQANEFASAFLMPRAGLLGSLHGNVSLDDLPRLRELWKVSAMAITVRLHQLGVISDWTYRLMCQELSKRGFRRGEPGSTLIPELSSLWAQILADLREQGLGFPYIANLIEVRAADVRSLLVGLVPMAISGGATRSSRSSGDLRLVSS
ncbi:ImmA/IrrE family metallo-endopeptidase [Hoyosella sp. YIM 151337]|uniref:helix-turn-helix domain-containing protein n=1 Tax=Hoyosella sp. YIM 151337 TaxID=2992742 RepID=UPI002235AE1A|nr:ImmA/IrrE family metallo-endopeptidase [Hoyosella sp. YIM 151337]MCW4352880.1 ImmA/IrrE family metallo-endopeptidase [Hoyosella sp. YIM 151337]